MSLWAHTAGKGWLPNQTLRFEVLPPDNDHYKSFHQEEERIENDVSERGYPGWRRLAEIEFNGRPSEKLTVRDLSKRLNFSSLLQDPAPVGKYPLIGFDLVADVSSIGGQNEAPAYTLRRKLGGE